MTTASIRHRLLPRRVQFSFNQTPNHWLRNDPFSSHLINSIHMLLPPGEFWFCRVYNKALPLVTDADLRDDVQGFIRQEAIHARAHIVGQGYLDRQGYDLRAHTERANHLFEQILGDAPLGQTWLKWKGLERFWLVSRVGIIAAIEHFTGLLGQWAMDNTSWERDGDPEMVDLFKWHLAEEVEHRTVAFELFRHLCKTETGFYLGRQALMALVFPLFVGFMIAGYRSLAIQDQQDAASRKLAARAWPFQILEMQRTGKRTQNVPTFTFLVEGTLRWLSPRFDPVHEGNTEQALAYLARSPAASAAAVRAAA